ncbi:hypothetical protein NDU88_000604 [Pleurodeles waltl]|uniref:Uncharacterized protein n=1 Tax=Pleurodeles waltl TaxID=8319 RepID=A0AAV7U3Y4_PLEWA|nr:hypothetical protein NDU88_000604 [Pleurodeles waltl]
MTREGSPTVGAPSLGCLGLTMARILPQRRPLATFTALPGSTSIKPELSAGSRSPSSSFLRSPIAHRASAARVERSRYKGGKDSPAASGRAAPSLSGSGWSSVYPRRSRWGRRVQPGLFVGEGALSCGAEATATPRSTIRDWTTAKVVRPAVLYTGLAPGAEGESR